MRGHAIMRQTKALIEAQGYDVIWRRYRLHFRLARRAHSEAGMRREIGHRLVRHVNEWWAQTCHNSKIWTMRWSWSLKPTFAVFDADHPRRG